MGIEEAEQVKEVTLSLSKEVILSMPAAQVVYLSLEEASTEAVGAFGIVPASLKLEASALENYKLAHKLFIGMLLPTDGNKLLASSHDAIRKRVMECFIQVS